MHILSPECTIFHVIADFNLEDFYIFKNNSVDVDFFMFQNNVPLSPAL